MPVSRHLSKLAGAGLLAALAYAPLPTFAAMCDTPSADCEILSNRTYTDPNTYDYTGWNSLDLMSAGGVYPTITQTGGTVIAKQLALWNGVAYNMSGGTANNVATNLLLTTSTISGSPTSGPAQYQLFTGLTGATFSLSTTGGAGGVISNNVFGLQIVAVPEPAGVALLLGAGAIGLVWCSRRKRGA